MKVVVMGAGVVGTASAWYLARGGHDVTVVDRQPGAGLETSFANGGQVSVSQSEPWAAPGAPFKVLKWLMRDDAPLLFRPRMEWHQLSWGLRFMVECLPWRFHRNIREMVNLGLYSRQCLHELRAETGIEYEQLSRGILQIYTSREDFEAGKKASRLLRRYGIEREPKSAEEAIAIEPALRSMRDRLAGATYSVSDESGDAHVFTRNLAALCAARGVQFHYGAMVEAIETAGNTVSGIRLRHSTGHTETLKADAYVCSMGSYSYLMLKPIGITIPVYPAKGYSATLSTDGYHGAPTVSLTDEAMKIVFSRLGNRLRVAGTAELDGYSTALSVVRTEMLVKRARELFPEAADYGNPVYWTGLRPSTPSNCPLIGRSRCSNLFLNTGHGTLGWTEAPGSGKALADIIAGREPEVDFRFLS
ncbi:MAG TPA: D-amino acid dehydrogenase [Usitatibacteraceae bacterium]|nr:D-amino acid dehydrogenase [Usitatibacteraceae bacterium]